MPPPQGPRCLLQRYSAWRRWPAGRDGSRGPRVSLGARDSAGNVTNPSWLTSSYAIRRLANAIFAPEGPSLAKTEGSSAEEESENGFGVGNGPWEQGQCMGLFILNARCDSVEENVKT